MQCNTWARFRFWEAPVILRRGCGVGCGALPFAKKHWATTMRQLGGSANKVIAAALAPISQGLFEKDIHQIFVLGLTSLLQGSTLASFADSTNQPQQPNQPFNEQQALRVLPILARVYTNLDSTPQQTTTQSTMFIAGGLTPGMGFGALGGPSTGIRREDVENRLGRKLKDKQTLEAAAAAAAAADDEGIASSGSPTDSPRTLRTPSHHSDSIDSARASSAHYGGSAPPVPASPNPSPSATRPPTYAAADDFLAEMLGDLHVSYKDYDDAPPASGGVANAAEGPRPDELDDIYSSYYTEDPVKEKAKRMARNRAKAVAEIVTTEATYVEMLGDLIDLVVRPMRDAAKVAKKPILPADDIAKLFCNVEEIHHFHMTLLDGLRERHSLWSDDQKISDIFLTILPYLKIYKLYMANYPTAMDTLTKLRASTGKAHAEANKLIKLAQENPRFRGLGITSFMILPIQRVPRYIMLLEQLVHYTSEAHPDYNDLTRCVAEVKKLADHINEELRRFEASKKVMHIASRLIGRPSSLPTLVTPARTLLREADIATPMLMAHDKRTVFLFTDLLVVAKRNKDGKDSYDYKDEVDLWHAWVKMVDDFTGSMDTNRYYTFHVVGGKKTLALSAPSAAERDTWVQMIESAVASLQSGGVKRTMAGGGPHGGAGIPDPLQLGLDPSILRPTSYGSGGSPSIHSPSSAQYSGGHPSRSSWLTAPPSPTASLGYALGGGSASSSPVPIPGGRRPSLLQSSPLNPMPASPTYGGQSPPPARRGSVATSRQPRGVSVARSYDGSQVMYAAASGYGQPPMPPVPSTPTAPYYATLPAMPPGIGSTGVPPAGYDSRSGVGHGSPAYLHRSRSYDANLYAYGVPGAPSGAPHPSMPPAHMHLQQQHAQQQQYQQQYQQQAYGGAPQYSADAPYPSSLDPSNPNFGRLGPAPSTSRKSRSNGGSDGGQAAAKDLMKSHGF
ncbi:hypothetical protein BC828DRAFT_382044 [Blastocladiella britannica]|nr:hypothetical protein BC828DRAFT_382044 [Blastocladiella britannica]